MSRGKALLITLGLALAGMAQPASFDVDPCLPPKPKQENRLVFQFTDFLSPADQDRLNTKLVEFARETSNRIAVVAVDTLCGYPASDFAFTLAEQWGLGKRGVDNGVLVLVKPHGAAGQRHVFIAVGYGLEAVIPDLTAKRIVDREMLPRFREGNMYAGVDKATDVLMALAKGEFNANSYGKEPFPWGILLMILGIFVLGIASAVSNTKRYARVNGIDFWTAWMLMNAASASHAGRWRGFSGGGGGRSRGGFGGFGGGSFGGGGAGGSW